MFYEYVAEDNRSSKLLMRTTTITSFGLVQSGFHHQYMRNIAYLNNEANRSEMGRSIDFEYRLGWSALLANYDGDGGRDMQPMGIA